MILSSAVASLAAKTLASGVELLNASAFISRSNCGMPSAYSFGFDSTAGPVQQLMNGSRVPIE